MGAKMVLNEKGVTPDGVSIKPLFIKQMAMSDWELIARLRVSLGGKTVADVVRHAIRRCAGQI
jgi:hypothetical protein